MVSYYIDEDLKKILLRTPYGDIWKKWRWEHLHDCKWDNRLKLFKVELSAHNLLAILKVVSNHREYDHLFELNSNDVRKYLESDLPVPISYSRPYPLPLWRHQELIKWWILDKRNCLVSAEMRTGKSRSTLEACREWLTLNPDVPQEIWWIAPKSAIQGLYREVSKLYEVGLRNKGKIQVNNKYGNFSIQPITYEQMQKVYHPDLIPPIVIFDEIHKLKTHNSNRGKLATDFYLQMSERYKEFLLVGLSGTPAPKDPLDWFNQLRVVAPYLIHHGHVNGLMEDLANTKGMETPTGFIIPEIVSWKHQRVADFTEKILDFIRLPLFKKETLKLPDKKHEMVNLPLLPSAKKAMRFLKTTCTTKIELLNKLAQISDGFLYDYDIDEVNAKKVRKTNRVKTPKEGQLIKDLIDVTTLCEESDLPVRVAVLGSFKETIDIITDICLDQGFSVLRIDGRGYSFLTPSSKINKDANKMLNQFDNSNELDKSMKMAVVGHPKSVATGLELSACPWMIYFSHTNDGESEFQSIERAHSANMNIELGLTIKHYIHLPIDELIINRLIEKKELQSTTIGELLSYLDKE